MELIKIEKETRVQILVQVRCGATRYGVGLEASELALRKNKAVEYEFNEQRGIMTVEEARLFLTPERITGEIENSKNEIEYSRRMIQGHKKYIAQNNQLLKWRKSLNKNTRSQE